MKGNLFLVSLQCIGIGSKMRNFRSVSYVHIFKMFFNMLLKFKIMAKELHEKKTFFSRPSNNLYIEMTILLGILLRRKLCLLKYISYLIINIILPITDGQVDFQYILNLEMLGIQDFFSSDVLKTHYQSADCDLKQEKNPGRDTFQRTHSARTLCTLHQMSPHIGHSMT